MTTQTTINKRRSVSPLFLVHGAWHKHMLTLYMLIVLLHFAEHLLQVYQVFGLHWARPDARGLLGVWSPELAMSEVLHTTYNLLQLIGLWVLRGGFTGRAHRWWTIAGVIQCWHFFEHFLLQTQWLTKTYLYGASKPMSVLEFLMPRIELHFIYNMLVVTPTLIALYFYVKQRKQAVKDV